MTSIIYEKSKLMSVEIWYALQEVVKALDKELSSMESPTKIDDLKNFIFSILALFIHFHDRVFFTEFGDKIRSICIDTIEEEIYKMFKDYLSQDAKGKEIEMDIEEFRKRLAEFHLLYGRFMYFISDANHLAESVVWNFAKHRVDALGVEDFGLFFYFYTLLVKVVETFSVMKLREDVCFINAVRNGR